MEFRYRAVDGDRPPFPFLSSPPIPGVSEDYLREAIRREIEKDQIRREIVLAETRRRELIAEVLHEMAIEREMAARGVAGTAMSLDDRLAMLINQRKLLPNHNHNYNHNNLFSHKCTYTDPMTPRDPYGLVTTSPTMHLPPLQRVPEVTPVLEPNKDKFIVLDRTDPVGSKRKAEDTQTGIKRSKRKLLGLSSHGLEEKAKLTATKAKPVSVETGGIVSSKLPLNEVESKPKLDFKFWCDICGVGAFTEKIMRDHELGKKHLAAIKQQNKPPEAASTTSIVTPPPSQLETITLLGNANNVHDDKKVAEMETKETCEKKKKKKEKENKVGLWCELCNIWTYSETVMETHRHGKKHKALLEKQQSQPLAPISLPPQ